MKQKLLFLTPELPYPLQSGGKIKTWNMIQAFSKDWDITLVCPLKMRDEDYLCEFVAKASIEKIITDEVKVPRNVKNLIRSYIKCKPLNLLRTHSEKLAVSIKGIVDDYDLILVDHYEVFQFLPKNFFDPYKVRPPVIYHAHNAYHQIWQRFAETSKNPFVKTVCFFEAIRVKACELRICKKADLVFAAPNDITKLKSCGGVKAKYRETLHLGDDANLELPSLNIGSTKDKLCYAGFLGWEPNVQGLLWFLEEVWPQLKTGFPDLTLDIAGKDPDERLQQAVQQSSGVQLLGFVEDLDCLYRESRACICPLNFGSGIKVKVVSSMARGLPTVTTSVGAEGLDVENGKHLLIADDAQTSINMISQLLTDDRLWQRLSTKSRQLVRYRYTWRALFKQMFHDIADIRLAHMRNQVIAQLWELYQSDNRLVGLK